jgi:hypothetical protein
MDSTYMCKEAHLFGSNCGVLSKYGYLAASIRIELEPDLEKTVMLLWTIVWCKGVCLYGFQRRLTDYMYLAGRHHENPKVEEDLGKRTIVAKTSGVRYTLSTK